MRSINDILIEEQKFLTISNVKKLLYFTYENIFYERGFIYGYKILNKAKYGNAPMGKKVVKSKRVHKNYITKEDLKANPEGPNQIPWNKYFEEKKSLRHLRNKNKEKRYQKA